MIKFFITFVTLTFLSSPAFCKEYRIEELINIAEQNSSNIRSAQYLATSQKRFANQQKYWENPTIGIDRIWGENTFSINQSIPFYGKLKSKYNIEEAEYRILETRRDNLSLFVKAEVFSLIYQYKALKTKVELAQKRLRRLNLVDRYLFAITVNSPTKKAQRRITKSKIRLVERDLLKLQNKLYQTWNEANVYLNLKDEPTNINIEWLSNDNYKGKEFFISRALDSNLDLKEQEVLADKYKHELSFAKLEKMPDFKVSLTRQNGSAYGAGSAGINQDDTGVGLSVSIPLFDRNKEKISSAKSKIQSQKHALEFYRKRLINSLSNDISEYETSLKLARRFSTKDIKKIVRSLSIANSNFKRGVLDFVTYIELDSQEYQIIDEIMDTQINLANSYSRLMIKVGSFTVPMSSSKLTLNSINSKKNDK